MGWWEKILTFDAPEEYYPQVLYLSKESILVKEGTYSCEIDALSGQLSAEVPMGKDLSAYPSKAKIWLWFYTANTTDISEIRFGIVGRNSATYNYKSWVAGDLSAGWNHLSFTKDEVTTTAKWWEDIRFWRFWWNCASNKTFYLDDIYITTDETKILDTTPTYQIKHFDRYSVSETWNQYYAGILEPINFSFGKALNTASEATFVFERDAYGDLPEISDSVRIYRNGMCIWHGIVTRKVEDYEQDIATLYCKSSERVLEKVGNPSGVFYHITDSMELLNFLFAYAGSCDGGIANQDGFGIPSASAYTPGYSNKTLSTDRVIGKDELAYPANVCRNFQSQVQFDWELAPNFIFHGWYPEKGQAWDMKLIQDTHFKVKQKIYSGEDLWNACRAYSRGAQAAWVGTDTDATSIDTYGRFTGQVNASHIDSQTEIDNVADEFVDEYKDPATIFDIELMQGGWLYPWDTGDTITCVVDGTEYSKRIYAMNVTVTQEGEKVGLSLQ